MSTPTLDMTTFNNAVKSARNAAKNVNNAAWIIGDSALTVQTSYGQGKVQAFCDAIGMVYKTVLDFRAVADAYLPSERSDLNTWSIHQTFMREDDRAELVSARKWTVKEARAEIKSRKSSDGDDSDNGDNDSDNGDVDQRAKLVANITRLEGELAKARAALATYDAEHAAPAAPVADTAKPAASKPAASKPAASKPAAAKAATAKAATVTPAAPGSIAAAAKAAKAAKPAAPVVTVTDAPRRSRTRTPAAV